MARKRNWLGMVVLLAVVAVGCDQISDVMDALGFGGEEEVYIPENAQNYVANFSDLQDVLLKAKDKDEVEIVLSPLIKTENIDFNKGIGSLSLMGDNSPKRITIDGNGRVVNVVGSKGGALLTVSTDTVLTLRNITLQGLYPDRDPNDKANNTNSLVYVYGGELVLEDGVVIENNHFAKKEFALVGGGGVYVDSPGVLEMRGTSIIRNNEASVGPPGVVGDIRAGGMLIMTGGTIMNNKPADKGGVYFYAMIVSDGHGAL
jgi:hypothetical protein